MIIHGRFVDDMCIYFILFLSISICITPSVQLSLSNSSKLIHEKLNRNIRAVQQNNKLCPIPSQTESRIVTLNCGGNVPQECDTGDGYVPEFTLATVKCTTNYQSDKEGETELESICRNKKWLPEIGKCSKICKKLNPVNVHLQCRRNGIEFNCDENTIMLSGTRVRPECKQWHKFAQPPHYLEITCNDDGTWDNPLFSCIPECGQTFANPTPLIADGTEERFGDSPWHVAIYNKEKNLICGGTIISMNLVVSAAHCFTKNANYSKDIAKDYEVVVSKFTRNYYKEDNKNQKIFKIKDIRFSKKGFFGLNDNYASDVAILILQEPISISSTVLPACLDWIGLKNGKYPSEDELGKVVGWGMNEHGKYSEALRTADLPFISRERCILTVPADFRPYITFDKFCAGNESGPSVLQGDSGGGLLFKTKDIYYLRGIVSVKQPIRSSLAAFTDLSEHIQWISEVRYEIENGLKQMADLLQQVRFEMSTIARDDPSKLLQLSERLKKEVIDRSTIVDDFRDEALRLIDKLRNATQTAMIALTVDALQTTGLSKVHPLSNDILKRGDYTTYFNIFSMAVENMLSRMTATQFLSLVSRENEKCCIEELLTIYAAVFDRVQRDGQINSDSGVKLAERVRLALETIKNKNIHSYVKAKIDQIKDKLANSVKTPGASSPIVCLRNTARSEHTIVFDATGKKKPSEWVFEPDGENVFIKHKLSQKYIRADFKEKYNNTQRTALTFKLGNKSIDNKWKIINCPAGLIKTSQ